MRTRRGLTSTLAAIAFAALAALALVSGLDEGTPSPAWELADSVNTESPPSPPPGREDSGTGEDGGTAPDGGGDDSESTKDGESPSGKDEKRGAILPDLSMGTQIASSMGLIALAFLLLLPGRKPPPELG
ncbi:hypothetical protein [Salininema proteolyticum]|uniref:MYXO-CTERM domain-containing protein n=1 Tax=Salininema proteolyticum TaxID=1607685 RepID=A0ABV8TWY1_9ACTN